MGLLVDLKKEYNETMADIKGVYIRIETLQVFPKMNAIRANVTGFVSPESGYVMKQAAIAEVKEVEQFFFSNEILNGTTVLMERDETMPPVIQTGQEPHPIFRDYYTIYMKNEDGSIKDEFIDLDITDYQGIYSIFYDKIKEHEFRFENIRDVLIDPEV